MTTMTRLEILAVIETARAAGRAAAEEYGGRLFDAAASVGRDRAYGDAYAHGLRDLPPGAAPWAQLPGGDSGEAYTAPGLLAAHAAALTAGTPGSGGRRVALDAALGCLGGPVAIAWAAVEEYRTSTPRPTSRDWSADDTAWSAEEERLLALFRVAEERAKLLPAILADLLCRAEWGAQPDGSFVTRSSSLGEPGRSWSTLHAPRKGGPMATATEGWHTLPRVTEIRSREEARELREKEREANRAAAATYRAMLSSAITRLNRGETLPYTPGQCGGYVDLGKRCYVSAPGALRGCGLAPDAVDDHLSAAEATGRLVLLEKVAL